MNSNTQFVRKRLYKDTLKHFYKLQPVYTLNNLQNRAHKVKTFSNGFSVNRISERLI